jgi:hypothetical protein
MSDILIERLDAVRGRLRRVHLLAGISQSILALIGLLTLFFLFDFLVLTRSIDLGIADTLIRAALLLVILGVWGWVIVHTIVRELRITRSDDDIAMRVERTHPKLHGRLISTVQLAREEQVADSMISQEMIEALTEETVSFTEAMDFSAIINRRTLKRFGIGALVVIAVSVILGYSRRDYMHALVGRLTLTSAEYPTAARILEVTPGATIGRGDDFTVTVALDPQRQLTDTVTMSLRSADGKTTELTLTRVTDAPPQRILFRTVIEKAIDDFAYRPLALDARWPKWEAVHIIQRPAIKALKITFHFPAYLQRADEVSPIGDIRVPEGTTALITATFSKPLVKALLSSRVVVRSAEGKEHDLSQSLPMTLDNDKAQGTASLAVEHEGEWTLQLSDDQGFQNADPISYTLTPIPDHPPNVDVQFPAQDHEAVKYARWPVRFVAHDDHAVAKARLMWTVTDVDQGGTGGADPASAAPATATVSVPVKSLSIDLPPGGPQAVISQEVPFDLSQTGAAEGQRVTYWVEVDDNHQPQPNTASSAHYVFTILDPATIKAEFDKKKAETLQKIKEIKGKQQDIDTSTRAINSQTP